MEVKDFLLPRQVERGDDLQSPLQLRCARSFLKRSAGWEFASSVQMLTHLSLARVSPMNRYIFYKSRKSGIGQQGKMGKGDSSI